MPKFFLGKLSFMLIFFMPICFYIGFFSVRFYEFIPAGNTILEDLVTRPRVSLLMLIGFVSGITAFFTGIISIIKHRDRSVFVFLSTIIRLLVLLWCLVELLFPH